MGSRKVIAALGALWMVLVVLACTDTTGPPVDNSLLGDIGLVASVAGDDGSSVEPRIPEFEDGVELETDEVTFLAIRGQDCWATIRYSGPADLGCTHHAGNEYHNGWAVDPEIYLTLWVPRSALYQRPDGTNFKNGDAVEITIELDDEELLVSLEPSGLVFSEENPARLFLSYARAIWDFDGDGDGDKIDALIETQYLKLWSQEADGPWNPIQFAQSVADRWFLGWLLHFSDHAISW